MNSKNRINLWDGEVLPFNNENSEYVPYMDSFLLEGMEARGVVVVIPGGAYLHHGPLETTPIAKRYNELGYHAFVVYYRHAPNCHPAPLADALRAIRVVRKNAEQWHILPDRIAVCGFSAGGHLAASTGVFYDKGLTDEQDSLAGVSAKPDALILGYAVLCANDEAIHQGSMQNLTGKENPDKEDFEALSLERHVTSEIPPVFMWHTTTDSSVPVSHSLLFAHELRKNDVQFEMHIFPDGDSKHAFGLGEEYEDIGQWSSLSVKWLHKLGWE